MNQSDRMLTRVFTGVLLLFCLFLVWFVPSRADLDFQLADIDKSLETSYGRERKQQYEYDEVVAALPVTRAELEATQPLADKAAATVAELKAERKQLRAEKEELLAQQEAQGTSESAPVPESSPRPDSAGSEGGLSHE